MSSQAQSDASAPSGVFEKRHAGDVLRYWRALLRHQEALASRPRARRGQLRPAGPVNLQEPARGQDYLKLPWGGIASFLAQRRGSVKRELDAEGAAFFEHWLATQYRSPDGDERVALLVSFPTLLLPREELAGLLRFSVDLSFSGAAGRFRVPPPERRRAGALPECPTHLEIEGRVEEDSGLPYFIDTRLLRDTLGVTREELSSFFDWCRQRPALGPGEVIAQLTALLERPLVGDAVGDHSKSAAPAGASRGAAESLLGDLERALATRLTRLRSPSRVFPLALLVAADRNRTTWHVQRDIEAAQVWLEESKAEPKGPLANFLGARVESPRRAVSLGRWPRAPLTVSQREALELSLGSRFSAIQGPPGTGKTTLILNAVHHHWVSRLGLWATAGVMSDEILVVTSTNNRAVDTVLEPLAQGEFSDCPLGLRIGSREVLESVTGPTLVRVQRWLKGLVELDRDDELTRVKRSFAEQFLAVQGLVSPASGRQALELELAQLQVDLAAGSGRSRRTEAARVHGLLAEGIELGRVRSELAAARLSLEDLSASCAAGRGLSPRRVEGLYRRLIERFNALWAGAAPPTALPASLPPSADLEAWEECLDEAQEKLGAIESELEDGDAQERDAQALLSRERRVIEIEAELRRHSVACADAGAQRWQAELDAFRSLHELGLELRTLWIRRHRTQLLEAVAHGIRHAVELRSLRPLLASSKGHGRWFRLLFPCFGSTLLSLGNAFPPEAGCIERVVVDEAGQCHGAYTVSALLRAREALIIGDVHQLEPVTGLGEEEESRVLYSLRPRIDREQMRPFRMHDAAGNSAQSLAERAFPMRCSLIDHFRCQPEIAALSNEWCGYGMQVRTPPRSLTHLLPALRSAVLFQHVAGKQERSGGSWWNAAEIKACVQWVTECLAAGVAPGEVGVITPFRSQAEALFKALREARIPIERAVSDEEETLLTVSLDGGGVAVGTVHRFQGGERDLILLSPTATDPATLGFLDDRVNLLNVAVTRARQHLVVLGDAATLRQGRLTGTLLAAATRIG